jgi:hypothetical protein
MTDVQLPPALQSLAQYRAFIVYRVEAAASGKTTKIPINPVTLRYCDAHDSNNWMLPVDALAIAQQLGPDYGLGFVIIKDHGFFCIDLDHCLVDGQWHPSAGVVCSRFPNAAIEVSRSQDGLHILGRYAGSIPTHRTRSSVLGFNMEVYSQDRFIALTGYQMSGDISTDCTVALVELLEEMFTSSGVTVGMNTWTNEPSPKWKGPDDDAILIERMLASRPSMGSIFGGKASLQDLWMRNVDVLRTAFPPSGIGSDFDQSAADQAMANHLAWWCGGNCQRVYDLMWQSQLAREKWRRDDYMRATVMKACNGLTEFYNGPVETRILTPVSADARVAPLASDLELGKILFLDEQIELFKGCTYVEDANRVITTEGYLLDSSQFNARFGGYKFIAEPDGSKLTKSPWDAFVMSMLHPFPKVRGTGFYPLKEPNAIIRIEGQDLINSWRILDIRRVEGDISRFLNHLRTIFCTELDIEIVLNYMRFIVQYPGHKSRWAVFLQGVEGNGKSILSSILEYCVGQRYTHWAKVTEIDSKFNSAYYGKLLICIEDAFQVNNRAAVFEALKPMITGTRQEIEYKGLDKVTREVCYNFMINSNHKDGIRKTANDRRIAPIFCKQQGVRDLQRDGLTDAHFVSWVKWAEEIGYANIAHYLATSKIKDEFNPLYVVRAPETSCTREAIAAGLGGIEQEVLEAAAANEPGFAGGWVSSFHLKLLLQRLGKSSMLPPRRRLELMEAIGYEWHPYLPSGQLTKAIPVEGKPQLFILRDHLARNLTEPHAIAKAYLDAQQRQNFSLNPEIATRSAAS